MANRPDEIESSFANDDGNFINNSADAVFLLNLAVVLPTKPKIRPFLFVHSITQKRFSHLRYVRALSRKAYNLKSLIDGLTLRLIRTF